MASWLETLSGGLSLEPWPAVGTRAGCECVAHALQALCEVDPELTTLSIDGISAYALQGFREVNGQAVPYVMFSDNRAHTFGRMSTTLCIPIHQGEGGEQR